MVQRTEATYSSSCFVYEGIRFVFSLTHFYKKKVPGSTIKPNMCSFTFYFTWSMWLGTLVFSSSLRTYRKRFFLFCFVFWFSFFKAQVVHELLNIFLWLSFIKIFWYSSLKVKDISCSPLCLFILPTISIERMLLIPFFEFKYVHLNVAVP